MKKLVIILLVSFLIYSCSEDDGTKPAKQTLKIGAILSITGSSSSLGASGMAALELAESDLKTKLNEWDANIEVEFIVKNSETDSDVALAMLKELHAEGINVVIGPQTSQEAAECLEYANQNDILLLSPSSVAVSLAIENDNLFRMAPNDEMQGEAMAKMMHNLNINAMIGIVRNDVWGKDLFYATQQSFISSGLRFTIRREYGPDVPDFINELDEIPVLVQEAKAEYSAASTCIYLISFNEGTEILDYYSDIGIVQDVRWFGASAFAKNKTILDNPDAAEFAIKTNFLCPVYSLSSSYESAWQPVISRIEEKLGYTPDPYAATTYDAAFLIAKTFGNGHFDNFTDMMEEFLETSNSFTGITGPVKFNAAGDRASGSYDFYGIRKDSGDDFEWYKAATYDDESQLIIWK